MLTRFIHAIAALRHGVARRHGSVDSTLQHRHTILLEIIAMPLHQRSSLLRLL
jgi:hypothetical protein